jgi:hypothetical protein
MQSGARPKVNFMQVTGPQVKYAYTERLKILPLGTSRSYSRSEMLLEFHADLKTNENLAKMYTKNARDKKIQEIYSFSIFLQNGHNISACNFFTYEFLYNSNGKEFSYYHYQ